MLLRFILSRLSTIFLFPFHPYLRFIKLFSLVFPVNVVSPISVIKVPVTHQMSRLTTKIVDIHSQYNILLRFFFSFFYIFFHKFLQNRCRHLPFCITICFKLKIQILPYSKCNLYIFLFVIFHTLPPLPRISVSTRPIASASLQVLLLMVPPSFFF